MGASLIRLSDLVELARDYIEKPTSNSCKIICAFFRLFFPFIRFEALGVRGLYMQFFFF